MNKIIYGIHALQTLLNHDYSCLKYVFILKKHKNKRLLSIIYQLKKRNIPIQLVSNEWMNNYTKNAVHQGIIAEVYSFPRYKESDLDVILSQNKLPFFLILDCITDSYNLGACLRSAEAAGVNAVIITKNKSAYLNAIVRKVACGAAEHIPLIQVINLARIIRKLQKNCIRIISTTINSNNIYYNSNLTGAIALIMGSEDKGIRRLTKIYSDELISIPMVGIIKSLNISVATGICLFEAIRQRSKI